MLQEVEHVLKPIAKVYAPILEPPIQKSAHVPELTAEEAQSTPPNRQQCNTLWYLYQASNPLFLDHVTICNHFVQLWAHLQMIRNWEI